MKRDYYRLITMMSLRMIVAAFLLLCGGIIAYGQTEDNMHIPMGHDGSSCLEARSGTNGSAISLARQSESFGYESTADTDSAVPYALLTGSDSNKTLTFYYGAKPDEALPVAETYRYEYERAWDSDTTNIEKVVFDPSFAQYRPVSTRCWFYNLKFLKTVEGMENLNTTEVYDMRWMFWGCSSLKSLDVSGFNTGKVLSMRSLFYGCSSLEAIDVSRFNTSKVQDMSFMFDDCISLTTLDVSNFDTRNVTEMTEMFRGCEKLKTIDVSGFNTSKVTKMGWLFCRCTELEYVDVSKFDTRNVEIMTSMFWNCNNLKAVNVSNFNTGKVKDMGWMFLGCTSLTSLDVSTFDTRNVENMNYMFYNCANLSVLDLTNFDTRNVTNMSYMFNSSSALSTIYVSDGWTMSSVTDHYYMFYGCINLVGGHSTTYNAYNTDGTYAQVDKGASSPGYLSTKGMTPTMPYAILTGSGNNKTLTFYYGKKPDSAIPVGLRFRYPGDRTWDADTTNIEKVVFDPSFAQYRPVSTRFWFYNMQNLTDIEGLAHLNTSEVTDMYFMFAHCQNLSSLDLSTFDTHNVENMSCMFSECFRLTSLDFSKFNTQKVNNMSYMFGGCYRLTSLDLSSFDTQNVENMRNMFINCSGLTTLNISSFNTQKVTDMSYMFYSCSRLTFLDVSSFDTRNVEGMRSMFYSCSSLLMLDLSGFDTSSVTDMSYMFNRCSKLSTIYVGDNWSMKSVASHIGMFVLCSSLVGGQGTLFSNNYTDGVYALIDVGPNTPFPGYFTDKTKNHVCEINGVSYLLNNVSKTATVSYHGNNPLSAVYSGTFTIPETITVAGNSYSVTAIGPAAYYGCTSLQEVALPSNLSSIGMYSFADCSSLSSIAFPPTLRNVGMQAFANCTAIKDVHISDIDAWWHIKFADNRSNPALWSGNLLLNSQPVTDVELPSDLTVVGSAQFKGIRCLKKVVLHDGVTRINDFAFQGCTGLDSINFPSKLTYIGTSSFHECHSLRVSVDLGKTQIKTLNATCFFSCEKIPSVSLPATLTIINNRAFKNDTSIVAVFSYITDPLALSTNAKDGNDALYPFDCDISDGPAIYQTATLYVPKGTVEAYKSSAIFGGFERIMEMDEMAGIATPQLANTKKTEAVYDLQGHKLEHTIPGLNIIRTNDGRVRKAMVK